MTQLRVEIDSIRLRNSAVSEVSGHGTVGGMAGAIQILELPTDFAKTLQIGRTLSIMLEQK
jgi:hypothetical protein